MKRILSILIALFVISCSTDEDEPYVILEDYSDLVELRQDFTCISYGVETANFDYEDNTSYQVLYSYNLREQSVWLDDVLVDNKPLYNFDDGTIFTYDDEADASYTFYKDRYQLEIWYTGAETVDFHCFAKKPTGINGKILPST